jgi:hypothetical protein
MRSTVHDPLLTAENKLWRAVLEQAYVDAESGYETESNEDGDGPPERFRARCYLRGDSKPDAAALTMVCGFAELPADRVLKWARKSYPRRQIQQPFVSRAPSQNAMAISATEARYNRGVSGEPASI